MDYALLGVLGTVVTTVGTLTWFISSQFTGVRKLIYEEISGMRNEIVGKLEYHEKHDDQRFASITNDLWAIRVRNAAMDGIALEPKNKHSARN